MSRHFVGESFKIDSALTVTTIPMASCRDCALRDLDCEALVEQNKIPCCTDHGLMFKRELTDAELAAAIAARAMLGLDS